MLRCVFSSGAITRDLRSRPPTMTRSMASCRSSNSICLLSLRAAMMAPSLTTFSISAPTMPGVALAKMETSRSGSMGLPFMWTLKMASRPFMSGASRTT